MVQRRQHAIRYKLPLRVFYDLPLPRNIEMTPLCKVEVTLPRALGSWGVRRGGVVDEQAGVQPASDAVGGFSRVVCVSVMRVC
jgi:hypothetical protein